jgi:hypothetical protein
MPAERQFTFKLDVLKKDKFTITPAGFLITDAIVTRAGIFDYYENGKLVREYRSPDEVFSKESMDSLKFIPVTAIVDDSGSFVHPQEKIDGKNYKDYMVGSVGENVERKPGDLLGCKVQIMDKDTVSWIQDQHKNGKDVSLSLGYSAIVANSPGVDNKEGRYDAVQKNIVYNHLSIVDKGRAGEHVKLKLDQKGRKDNMPDKTVQINHPAIRLDGFTMDALSVEVPEAQVPILNNLLAKLDAAANLIQTNIDREKTEISKKDTTITELEASRDEHKDSLDKVKKDLEEVKAELSDWQNPTSDKVQSLLKSRADLEETAKALEVKVDGLTDKQIKIEVVKKVHDGLDISEREDTYIDARYDSCKDLLAQAKKDDGNNNLGAFRKTVVDKQTKPGADPKDLFKRKSDALARGEDPNKITE